MINAFIEQLNEFVEYATKNQYTSFNQDLGYYVTDGVAFTEKAKALISLSEQLLEKLDQGEFSQEQLEELKFTLYQSTPALFAFVDPQLHVIRHENPGLMDAEAFIEPFKAVTTLINNQIDEKLKVIQKQETASTSGLPFDISEFKKDIDAFVQYIQNRQYESVRPNDGAFVANRDEFSTHCDNCIAYFEACEKFLSSPGSALIDQKSLRDLHYALDKWFKIVSNFHEPPLSDIIWAFMQRYTTLSQSISQLIQNRLKKPKSVMPLWEGHASAPSSSSPSYSSSAHIPTMADDTIVNNITNKLSEITQYFTERKFETQNENGSFQANIPGFIAFTEKTLSDLNHLYQSFSQTKESPAADALQRFTQSINDFLSYHDTFHDPSLTGLLEPFQDSLLELANKFKSVNFNKKSPPIGSPGLYSTYSISGKLDTGFNIYDAIPKFFITDQPWLDIPARSSLTALKEIAKAENDGHHENKPASTLLKLIDAYHALKKSDPNTLTLRIKMLGFINRYAQDVIDSLPDASKEISNNIITRTYNKSLYLACLYERSQIYDYFTDSHKKEIEGLEFSRSIAAGDTITDIDPCCRHATSGDGLHPLIEEWRRNSGAPISHLPPASFYLWLEDHEDLTLHMKMEFQYYDPTQGEKAKKLLKTSRLRIMELDGDRVFVDQNLEKLNSLENIEFVISAKHELYLNYNLENKQRGGNHPTLIEDGKPVLCAGHITIKNGKITFISNNSGHYQPSPRQLWQALCLLDSHNLISEKATFSVINSATMLGTYAFSEAVPFLVPDPRYQSPPVDSPFSTEVAPHPRRAPN